MLSQSASWPLIAENNPKCQTAKPNSVVRIQDQSTETNTSRSPPLRMSILLRALAKVYHAAQRLVSDSSRLAAQVQPSCAGFGHDVLACPIRSRRRCMRLEVAGDHPLARHRQHRRQPPVRQLLRLSAGTRRAGKSSQDDISGSNCFLRLQRESTPTRRIPDLCASTLTGGAKAKEQLQDCS